MPDITGSINIVSVFDGAVGAFSSAENNKNLNGTAGGIFGRNVTNFEASRSNSEYGAQPSIMPASADMAAGIYLGQTA